VFVVGEEGLVQTLLQAGVPVGDDAPDAVVVGISRGFNYDLLERAATFIRQGSVFIATNLDATYPLEKGRLQPGSGAIVAAIEVASGKKPDVLGKPFPDLAFLAIDSAGAAPEETLVVGDRIDTDIACGIAAGCDTFLVTTGVETQIPAGQAGGTDLRSLL
jgi:HAD superfamily hydrolase (TIGR01450 family)